MAFHPRYASNGRFFVYYTRLDGTIVVAEYRVSADPNVANTTGATLLRIAHPINANHNGGMLAFGPDGYLYIGVGDGGSANDPPNNAQNVNVLLGKILRIDVDHPDPFTLKPYSSPRDNPFVGRTGRPEIFSIGWRNPWRFSFDRSTHQQWVADVGQGAREEVDTPIVKGGNYGWRVFEGSRCSGNDPALCNPANYIGPVFDYTHTGGRCSITGGYVYRGLQNALPQGTYVYGDFCSGEIFAWDGAAQSLLLAAGINISSFGEDEQGELYVVDLGGTLSKITTTGPTCAYDIAPASRSIGAAGGAGAVAVTATEGCVWTAASNASWIHAAASGNGNGDVAYSVDAEPIVDVAHWHCDHRRTHVLGHSARDRAVHLWGLSDAREVLPVRAQRHGDGRYSGGLRLVSGEQRWMDHRRQRRKRDRQGRGRVFDRRASGAGDSALRNADGCREDGDGHAIAIALIELGAGLRAPRKMPTKSLIDATNAGTLTCSSQPTRRHSGIRTGGRP